METQLRSQVVCSTKDATGTSQHQPIPEEVEGRYVLDTSRSKLQLQV